MRKVKDILKHKNRDTVSVRPETPVIEVLQLMADNNIGSAVVMDNDQYAGIVTERDYSRKVILKGKNSSDTHASHIMSTDLPRVSPEDSIGKCMELMSQKHIRYLPVFEGENYKGIISMSDVVQATILTQKEIISQLESYISGG